MPVFLRFLANALCAVACSGLSVELVRVIDKDGQNLNCSTGQTDKQGQFSVKELNDAAPASSQSHECLVKNSLSRELFELCIATEVGDFDAV